MTEFEGLTVPDTRFRANDAKKRQAQRCQNTACTRATVCAECIFDKQNYHRFIQWEAAQ
jgi:hypothetical protein